MDLSKLPKLSKTDVPANTLPADSQTPDQALPQHEVPGARPAIEQHDRRGIGGDVWFNFIIALLLMYLSRMFIRYLISRLSGQPFHTGIVWQTDERAGQEVTYPELEGFQMISDAGIFAFGLVVLFEAIAKAIYGVFGNVSRLLLQFALLLTALSTLFNLYVAIKLVGIGLLPLISGLAVAFGGYIVADLYGILSRSHAPFATSVADDKK